jgi:vesicle coat complex subunit
MENTTNSNNEKALNYIKNIIESRNNVGLTQKEVKQTITHKSYEDLAQNVYFLLEAIEIIAMDGSGNNSGIISWLADLGKKIMPMEEMQFLDTLLLEKK